MLPSSSKTGRLPRDLAARLNPAIFAWMAVPFNDPVRQQVQGILYVDSTGPGFFH